MTNGWFIVKGVAHCFKVDEQYSLCKKISAAGLPHLYTKEAIETRNNAELCDDCLILYER